MFFVIKKKLIFSKERLHFLTKNARIWRNEIMQYASCVHREACWRLHSEP